MTSIGETSNGAGISLVQRVIEISDRGLWEQRFQEMVQSFELTDRKLINATKAYLNSRLEKIHGLCQDLSDPMDEPDLKAALLYWYIEAKCEWAQFNQRTTYQMMTTGMPSMQLMIQASMGTALLEQIEKIFLPTDIEALSLFLSSPLESSIRLQDLSLNEVTEDQTVVGREVLEDIQSTLDRVVGFQVKFGAALAAQESSDEAGIVPDLKEAAVEFEELMLAVQQDVHRINDLSLIVPRIRRLCARLAEAKGMRCQVQFNIDPSIRLSRPLFLAMRETLEEWLTAIVESGSEPSAQARIDAGKSAQIAINVAMSLDEDRVVLEIRDDGIGLDPQAVAVYAADLGLRPTADELNFDYLRPIIGTGARPDAPFGFEIGRFELLANQPDSNLHLHGTPGQGSLLSVWAAMPVPVCSRDFVVVEAQGGSYALPVDSISFISRVEPEEIQTPLSGPKAILQGQTLALVELSDCLEGHARTRGMRQSRTVLAVKHGPHQVGLAVDAVQTYQRAIVRPIQNNHVETANFLTGIIHRGKEQVCLAVDLPKLMELILPTREERRRAPRPTAA